MGLVGLASGFHEIQFPTDIAYGSTGGPEFSTQIQLFDSGGEQRIGKWMIARHSYEIGTDLTDRPTMYIIYCFFLARRGKLFGFRFKDWLDYQTQAPMVLDYSAATAQLVVTYADDLAAYTRNILKPVIGTIIIHTGATTLVEGTDYTIDYTSGIVTWIHRPTAATTWQGQYDIPVRFDTDKMDIDIQDFDIREWKGIPVVEVLN